MIANTADDLWLHGLKVCPDLDTVMYTLGGGIDAERGWGRADETWRVKEELAAYGVEPTWFGLGDRDLATHLVRTRMLDAGYPLSAGHRGAVPRWQPGRPAAADDATTASRPTSSSTTPMSPRAGGRCTSRSTGSGCRPGCRRTAVLAGRRSSTAKPAPGVLEAIAEADVVLLPPSNPVVSVGTILAVPGIRDALHATAAPVVGLSPIVGGAHVRGMAASCSAPSASSAPRPPWPSTTALARAAACWTAGWSTTSTPTPWRGCEAAGVPLARRPLMMTEPAVTAGMAADALDLAAARAGPR